MEKIFLKLNKNLFICNENIQVANFKFAGDTNDKMHFYKLLRLPTSYLRSIISTLIIFHL